MNKTVRKFVILAAVGLFVYALISFAGLDWSSPKHDGSCAFCQKEVLERQMIYRGELASIFATHKPVVKGHVLVIPNRHVEMFDGLTEEELAEMGALMKKAHISEQYLVLQKNGVLAGQSVPHVHFHILPRTEAESLVGFIARFFLRPWQKAISHEEMKAYVTEMAEALGT